MHVHPDAPAGNSALPLCQPPSHHNDPTHARPQAPKDTASPPLYSSYTPPHPRRGHHQHSHNAQDVVDAAKGPVHLQMRHNLLHASMHVC